MNLPSDSPLNQVEAEDDDMTVTELIRNYKGLNVAKHTVVGEGNCDEEATGAMNVSEKTPAVAIEESGKETTKEDEAAPLTDTSSDMESSKYCDLEELQLEERISRLEKIFAGLK